MGMGARGGKGEVRNMRGVEWGGGKVGGEERGGELKDCVGRGGRHGNRGNGVGSGEGGGV